MFLATGPRSRHQVLEIQRARILAAAVDAIDECGYAGLTVAAVIQRARISRKTFYEVFANRHECFTAVVEHVLARAHSVVSTAYSVERGWLAATRSALKSLLCLIDDEPALAQIWFVDALAGPESVHELRARATAIVASALDAGRSLATEKRQPSQLTAEATVGGISQIIYSRLAGRSKEPFVDLLGPLMYLIVLPYLGAARARAELQQRPTQKSSPRAVQLSRPKVTLRDMNLRVTYRTTRVLGVVSAQPGISNRMVAAESGIKDQGQISKLLARLEGLALIENFSLGQGRGGANAWHVTERGLEIVRATDVHAFISTQRA